MPSRLPPAGLWRLGALWRAHPDRLALGLVLGIGLALRLAFAFRAPVLVMGDSETYLGPALELERGGGLDLSLKRTPGYPLLIALSLALFGEDLRSVVFVQHLLGLVTTALTYLLARLLAGPGCALLAGLAVALAGNLLIYERLVMTETLFATLLVASICALVLAAEGRSWRWLLVTGLALGAATLVRPVAQVILLLGPVALLLAGAGFRRTFTGWLVVVLGFGFPVGAWGIRGALSSEGPAVGGLGQTLVGRTARHDRRDQALDSGFVYLDRATEADEANPTTLAARKILQDAADRGSSGRAVHTRLRKELGLSDAEADRLMRDLAIQAILRRPHYYLRGTVERFGRIWLTPPERLAGAWSDRETIRQRWEHAASAPLLVQLPGPVERELPYAEWLARIFQPSRLGMLYPALFSIGLVAALATRRHRLALVPALGALALIGSSVALVGGVARYRYPEDPLILVVSAVGLSWLTSRLTCLLERGRGGDRPAT